MSKKQLILNDDDFSFPFPFTYNFSRRQRHHTGRSVCNRSRQVLINTRHPRHRVRNLVRIQTTQFTRNALSGTGLRPSRPNTRPRRCTRWRGRGTGRGGSGGPRTALALAPPARSSSAPSPTEDRVSLLIFISLEVWWRGLRWWRGNKMGVLSNCSNG